MFEDIDRAFWESNAAHARFLALVSEVDAADLWIHEGATSTSAWLRGRYGATKATALEWVRVARALRELPAISSVSLEGRLSFEQLRPLTKFAKPESDADLARRAPSMSAPELWDEARRHERVSQREADEVHRNRTLWIQWNEERTEFYMQGRFGAEQGAVLETAITKRSQEIELADAPANPQGARTADALLELVAESAGAHAVPTLVLRADASVLTGVQGAGEAEDGARLPAEAVRRLACDARIEWSLEQGGRTVGIGRLGRFPPGWLLRAVRYRDQACVFPGCGRIRWLKAHHIVHWTHGGRTDLENIVLLCHAHHRLVHEGGWSIRGRPGQDLRFCDPRGREPFLRQWELGAA